jgi:hypothetical protein
MDQPGVPPGSLSPLDNEISKKMDWFLPGAFSNGDFHLPVDAD